VEVSETPEDFKLRFGGAGEQPWEGLGVELSRRWARALGELAVPGPELLEGLSISVDFGDLWGLCPPPTLLTSPALAAALALAVRSHRRQERRGHTDLAHLAGSLCCAVAPGPAGDAGRHYAGALLSLVGGAGYVEKGLELTNVQSLLPPEAMLLVLAPHLEMLQGEADRERAVLKALACAQQEGLDFMAPGDKTLSALFSLPEGTLDQEQTTMLYGLLRVRQMIESFIEFLGEPVADNDRLAETCDEESAILKDYFGFPPDAYSAVASVAAGAGALGVKLTWAFGGYPAAIVLAPGRREAVAAALAGTCPEVACLPVDVEPYGLLSAGERPVPPPADGGR
jgi:hypothetical protein